MNTNIRWLAAYTADIFDDYLAEIKLPIVCSDASEEEDRHSNENSAMLYGMEYWNLVEDIEAYLRASAEKPVNPNEILAMFDTLLTDKGHMMNDTECQKFLDNNT